MTSTATNTCIETTGCHFIAGHLSDLLQAHTSASTLLMTSTLYVLRVSDISYIVESCISVLMQERYCMLWYFFV